MAQAFWPKGLPRLRKGTRDGNATFDAGNFQALTQEERSDLRSLVYKAGEIIPRSWPLGDFVYRNALQGL